MSAGPGKVETQGVTKVNGEKVFVLRYRVKLKSCVWRVGEKVAYPVD